MTTFVSHIFPKTVTDFTKRMHVGYNIENEDVVKDKGEKKTSNGNQIMKSLPDLVVTEDVQPLCVLDRYYESLAFTSIKVEKIWFS